MRSLSAKGLLLPLIALAIVASMQADGQRTLAVFTDVTSSTGNTFTTGTVDISTSPTSALVTFSNMAPGDKVTAPLTVTNAGTLQLRYAVASSATDSDGKGLRGQLTLAVKSGVTTCTNSGFSASGASLYAGALASTGTINVIGDPTAGAHSGDRTLNSVVFEVLCFQAELPASTGNAFQNATTTATFTFNAEQTTNN